MAKKKNKGGSKAPKTQRRRSAWRRFRSALKSGSRSARRGARRAGRRIRRAARSEGKGIVKSLRNTVSKDNLQIAGGVIASNLVNGLVQRQFGGMLPMNNTTLGKTAYTIAIPVLASLVVRRFAPKVAEGMALGGLITAVNQLVGMVAPQVASGSFGSYVDSTPPQPVIPYPTSSIGAITGSIDSGSRTSASLAGYSGIYDSPMPFQSDAWSN